MLAGVIYESFNARNLTPEEVAKTFVVPDEFSELCGNNHSVLMGPRGSGKTTMLKMLTARALHSWKDREADHFRKVINFTAVYVPTDIHWHHQLFHSSESNSRYPELELIFAKSAVTTNVLFSLAASMEDRLRLEGKAESEEEVDLCKSIIRAWRLPPTLPILPAIREVLAGRLNDAYIDLEKARRQESLQAALSSLPDYFNIDYLAASRAACATFDRLLAKTTPTKWALCFDELELAPAWLQNRLFTELRSTDERFLYKLSTSPMPDLAEPGAASAKQDFAVIRLWSHGSKSQRSFSERLVEAILRRSYTVPVSPEALFGSSPLSQLDDDAYGRGSSSYVLFRELAEIDPDFRKLLSDNEISPVDPYTNDIQKRDQILRKAKPIALQRLALLKRDKLGGRPVGRSRKSFNIYYGKEAIYDISDGNPRWLYGIVSEMLANIKAGKRGGPPKRIPVGTQEKVLRETSSQFMNFLGTVPGAYTPFRGSQLSLVALLETLGEYFFSSIVSGPFSLDPFGSFWVENETSVGILKLLRIAAYHGAIVIVEPNDSWVYSDPRAHRFRISYLLAPEFRLPLRLYKDAPLSRCLSGSGRAGTARRDRGRAHPKQATLPFRG